MIHYHGTPISGASYDILPFFEDRNFLVSFLYRGNLLQVQQYSSSYLLDNGAFTLWRQGKKPIDFLEYKDFVEENTLYSNYSGCFIPDTIDGGIIENDKMLDRWITLHGEYKSIPVFHYHEPLSRLKELSYFPIVALGSSDKYAKIGTVSWTTRTKEIFYYYKEEGLSCKLHGLRMLNRRIFIHYPYYSGDSTNVARNINMYKTRQGLSTRLKAATELATIIESHLSTYNYKQEKIP